MLNSGYQNPTSSIGMYAGDMESYYLYKPVFSYVIKKYHKFDPDTEDIKG